MEPLPLEIERLFLQFHTPDGTIQAIRGVSLCLRPGEILVLAGESGCGKSVVCRSVMKLLPRFAKITGGAIRVQGRDITAYTDRQMEAGRGQIVSMVFQNPLTALNPSMTIGAQLAEAIRRRRQPQGCGVREQAAQLLGMVGLDDASYRLDQLPQTLSGGQRQRCALAIALAARPAVLLADEPTTALDVTVQIHLLDLLVRLAKEQQMAIVLVTHDLGIAARIADRVGIMYAGQIVEIGTAEDIFYDARHPYTWGLLSALPSAQRTGRRLQAIPGMPPDMLCPPKGDAFANRNPYAMAIDYEQEAPMFTVSPTHQAATWLLDPRAPAVTPPVWRREVGR